jgi:hypothetical protein
MIRILFFSLIKGVPTQVVVFVSTCLTFLKKEDKRKDEKFTIVKKKEKMT